MGRSHNQKRNRMTFARASRQNQTGAESAFSTLEQQIIEEQRLKREQLAKDAPTRAKESGDIRI